MEFRIIFAAFAVFLMGVAVSLPISDDTVDGVVATQACATGKLRETDDSLSNVTLILDI